MSTLHTIRKSNGKMRGERLTIKGFKTSQAMHEFLNKQCDNTWKITSEPDYYGAFNAELAKLKPGIYAYAGGAWHNVKSLDSSVLAHI